MLLLLNYPDTLCIILFSNFTIHIVSSQQENRQFLPPVCEISMFRKGTTSQDKTELKYLRLIDINFGQIYFFTQQVLPAIERGI
ncbi:hypothetical protein GCM10008915_69920 [Bifidobacterium pullorum subsp. gallinarum]